MPRVPDAGPDQPTGRVPRVPDAGPRPGPRPDPGRRPAGPPAPGARGPRVPDPEPAAWDGELSDPSELAGWRPPAPAGRRGDPRPTGTQVLDRGWQDRGPAPARPDDYDPGHPGGPGFPGGPGIDPEPGAEPMPAPARRVRPAEGRPGHTRGRAPRAPVAPPEPDRRSDRSAGPELPYVAGLDGLRAVALLGILAFHQGFQVARGGFLGISSFLTLSGFLVTSLVLAEWADGGRIDLARLWERRARRILPGAIVTVAAVVVLQAALRVGTGPGYKGDVLASLGQVLNWRFALTGDGFASVLTDPSPVQHLWSVSLLVQLTIVVPIAFIVLMRFAGRRWRAVGVLFAAAAAVSFLAARSTAARAGNDGIAYYGTHTRAGELLVGVVLAYLALSPGLRRALGGERGSQALRIGGPLALVGLAWLWHSTSLYSTDLFAGVTAVNAALTAVVILAVTQPGALATGLGSVPMRWLGRVSYAAYLVHWPLFLLLDGDRTGMDGVTLFAVRLAATLAAAAVLTFGFERPLRRSGIAGPQLAAGLGVGLVVVAAAAVVLPQQPPPGVSLDIAHGPGPGKLDVVAPAADEKLSIVVVGGSLAKSLTPGFAAWNDGHPDAQVRVATHVADDCPLAGAGAVRLAGRTVGESTDCVAFAPRLPGLLDAAHADVVVVAPGAAELGDRQIDRQWRHLGDPAYDDWLRQRLADLADELSAHAEKVVWTTSLHVRMGPAGGGGDWTTVAANDPARVDRLNELIRSVARDHKDVTLVDLDAWAHQLPSGGEFGAANRSHGRDLSADGATGAAAYLMPRLLDAAGKSAAGG
ncbi:MAG TPA: acyltransferase family protein [Acidimicrobiales bacterium]|nr:acyltransferase family protein [Acidimicrobiales bacterium]